MIYLEKILTIIIIIITIIIAKSLRIRSSLYFQKNKKKKRKLWKVRITLLQVVETILGILVIEKIYIASILVNWKNIYKTLFVF